MKIKKIKKENRKRMFIDVQKNGFTLWIKEPDGRQHWLIDGSTVLTDGIVSVGDLKQYMHGTKVVEDYAERGTCVVIVDKTN